MSENIITLGKYTYERAQIVKSILDSDGIECFLENINLIQGAVSFGVKVRIRETDLKRSLSLLEEWLKPHTDIKTTPSDENTKSTPKILLPIDFSDYSRKAADFAFDWAKEVGAEITLIHTYFDPVVNTLPFTDTYMYDANLEELAMDLKENGEKGLSEMLAYIKAKPNAEKVTVHSLLTKGVAEDEIIRFSKSYEPSVIMMGTRGKDRKSTDLIGSVTAEVIDMARVPVLAVPEDFPYSGIKSLGNVLYLTNFEEADFKALEILERLLKPLGVKIICAHFGPELKNKWDEVRMAGLREYLKNKYNETDVVCDLVPSEDFWVGIEGYVRQNKVQMMCITTHRRNIISRLLNPSIAKKMLFHSTTPLLVFHA
jgi:nucleotide-binding universal stress UspA family protein